MMNTFKVNRLTNKKKFKPKQEESSDYEDPQKENLSPNSSFIHLKSQINSDKFNTTTIKNGIRNLINTFRIYCKKCIKEAHISDIMKKKDIMDYKDLFQKRRTGQGPTSYLDILLKEVENVIPPKMFYNNQFFDKVAGTKVLKKVLQYWIINMGEYCILNQTHVNKNNLQLYRILIPIIAECLVASNFKSIYKLVKRKAKDMGLKAELDDDEIEPLKSSFNIFERNQSKLYQSNNVLEGIFYDQVEKAINQLSICDKNQKNMDILFGDVTKDYSISDKSRRQEIDDLQFMNKIQWPVIHKEEYEEYAQFFDFNQFPQELGNSEIQLSEDDIFRVEQEQQFQEIAAVESSVLDQIYNGNQGFVS